MGEYRKEVKPSKGSEEEQSGSRKAKTGFREGPSVEIK